VTNVEFGSQIDLYLLAGTPSFRRPWEEAVVAVLVVTADVFFAVLLGFIIQNNKQQYV